LLFLKKVFEFFPSSISAFCRFCLKADVYEFEIIAKIASCLVEDPLGLGLPALIVGALVIINAVKAAAKVCAAIRAKVFSSYFSVNVNFFFTFMAYFHSKISKIAILSNINYLLEGEPPLAEGIIRMRIGRCKDAFHLYPLINGIREIYEFALVHVFA